MEHTAWGRDPSGSIRPRWLTDQLTKTNSCSFTRIDAWLKAWTMEETEMRSRRGRWLASGIVAAFVVGFCGGALANDEIEKRAKDPNQWPAPGRDNQLTRHSPLKDITTDNVAKLQMAWS